MVDTQPEREGSEQRGPLTQGNSAHAVMWPVLTVLQGYILNTAKKCVTSCDTAHKFQITVMGPGHSDRGGRRCDRPHTWGGE